MRLIQIRNEDFQFSTRTLDTASLNLRNDGEQSEGIFEGYAVTWNYVDSYKSMFIRGCFAESIDKRLPLNNIKVLNQHNIREPIGIVTEAIEDDTGLFVRGKINIDKQLGRDVLSDIRAKVFNALSFGFTTSRGGERYRNGIQEITKAELFEVSPVTFPASDRALISGVRAETFSETKEQLEANYGVSRAMRILDETIYDIFYKMVYNAGPNDDTTEYTVMVENCLAEFSDEMMQAFQKYIDVFRSGGTRSMPEVFRNADNKQLEAISKFRQFAASFDNPESMLAETSFTRNEYRKLSYPFDGISARELDKIKENCPTEVYNSFREFSPKPQERKRTRETFPQDTASLDNELSGLFQELNQRFFSED